METKYRPKSTIHFLTDLRGNDGGTQGEAGGASRAGGADRVERRSGREWTVELRSGGTRTASG